MTDAAEFRWEMPATAKMFYVGPLPSGKVEGDICYELTGPEDGQVVVLVHGIHCWMYHFDFLAKELAVRILQCLHHFWSTLME